MRLWFFLFFLSFAAIEVFSAPAPFSVEAPALGFSLSAAGTTWNETPPPPDATSVKLLFRGQVHPSNTQPTFTVRTESLNSDEKDVKDYFKRWLREYPKFGYTVLGSKPYQLDGRTAYVVDLISTTSNKQARQVISEKSKSVVLLTCLDEKDHFNNTVNDCNTIIKNFRWQ